MTDNRGRNLDYRIDLATLVLRRINKMTQRQLARKCRTSRQHISKVERREADPTMRVVGKLARAFRMSPRRFMALATLKD